MIIKLRSAELKKGTIVLFDGNDDAGGEWVQECAAGLS